MIKLTAIASGSTGRPVIGPDSSSTLLWGSEETQSARFTDSSPWITVGATPFSIYTNEAFPIFPKVELKNLGLRIGPDKPVLKLEVKELLSDAIRAVATLDDPGIDLKEAFVEVNGKEVVPMEISVATERKLGVGPEMISSRVLKVTFVPDQQRWFRPTPVQLLRYKIQRQLLMGTKYPKRFLNLVRSNDPEARARGLLRDIVGDAACNSYLRRGFLTVRGRSGLVYKISGQGTRVLAPLVGGGYDEYESICIVFRDNLPPTDAVVMRVMMVLRNEAELRRIGNVSRLNREKQFLLSEAMAILGGAGQVPGPSRRSEPPESIYVINGSSNLVWRAS